MTICVTQDDIDRGLQGSARYCPIARALKRQTHGKDVSCGTTSTVYHSHGVKYVAKLDDEASIFIREFDRWVDPTVEPCTIELVFRKHPPEFHLWTLPSV